MHLRQEGLQAWRGLQSNSTDVGTNCSSKLTIRCSTYLPSKTVLLPLQKRCWRGLRLQFCVSEDLWQQPGTFPGTTGGGIGGLLLPCSAQRSQLAAKHAALHRTAQQSCIQPRMSIDLLRTKHITERARPQSVLASKDSKVTPSKLNCGKPRIIQCLVHVTTLSHHKGKLMT